MADSGEFYINIYDKDDNLIKKIALKQFKEE